MKKIRLIILVFMIFGFVALVGCNDGLPRVGIIQYVTDGALDDARSGIILGLKDMGYEDGKNIHIMDFNPQADPSTLADMASRAVKKCDYIFCIATPVAQIVKAEVEKQGSDAQVFFTAVTDPVQSGIIPKNEAPGGNITGTNDMNPVADQIALANSLFAGKTEIKVGVIYTPTENNSIIQVNVLKAECLKLGFTIYEQTVSSSTEITNAVTALIGNSVDVIYLPTDNLVSANVYSICQKANLNAIPTICGEASMLYQGGTITYGVNYTNLGIQTGKMCARVMSGEVAKAGLIDSVGTPQSDLKLEINKKAADDAGITIPQELLSRADNVMED